jgi:hypothetical protein
MAVLWHLRNCLSYHRLFRIKPQAFWRPRNIKPQYFLRDAVGSLTSKECEILEVDMGSPRIQKL